MIELLTVRASAALTVEDARIWLRAGALSLEHSRVGLVVALQRLRFVDRADAASMLYAAASRTPELKVSQVDEKKTKENRDDRLRDRSLRAGFDCSPVSVGNSSR